MRHGFTGQAINRRLQLGFTAEEVAHLDKPLMPASTTYIDENGSALVGGENNPDVPEEQLEPLEGGDSTEPEDPQAGTDKTWTPEEAKNAMEMYNVSWEGEIELRGVLGYKITKGYEFVAHSMEQLHKGVRTMSDGPDVYLAFKRGDGEGQPVTRALQ